MQRNILKKHNHGNLNFKKILILFAIFTMIIYAYNYIFIEINTNTKTECFSKSNTILNKNQNISNHLNFWTLEYQILLEQFRIQDIYSKINFINLDQKYIVTLNCIGGKLDNYILKGYNKDVFFNFAYKKIGGFLLCRTYNASLLYFSDIYVLYEKIPGLFILIKQIASTIIICKIYKFSKNSKIIIHILKVINDSLITCMLNLDILFNIVNYSKYNNKHFDKAWTTESLFLIKNKKIIKKITIKNNILIEKFNYIKNFYYFVINHRYFITIVIIENKDVVDFYNFINFHRFYIKKTSKVIQTTNLIFSLKNINVFSHNIKKIKFNLYCGPKISSNLESIGHNIEKNINLGWFKIISKPMLILLLAIYSKIHNFGWAIILLTIFIKLITYPLTKKSIISLQKTKEIRIQV